MCLHLQQRLLSLLGQSISPRQPGQLFCGLSTRQPRSIVTSSDRGHGKARARSAKAWRDQRRRPRRRTRCSSLLPLCAGTWKEPAASTLWAPKHLQALLMVTPSSQGRAGSAQSSEGRAPCRGTPTARPSERGAAGRQRGEAVGPGVETRVSQVAQCFGAAFASKLPGGWAGAPRFAQPQPRQPRAARGTRSGRAQQPWAHTQPAAPDTRSPQQVSVAPRLLRWPKRNPACCRPPAR